MKITLSPISCERYLEALEALPPAIMLHDGFLLGEAWCDKTCAVTGTFSIAYHGYFGVGRDPDHEQSRPESR